MKSLADLAAAVQNGGGSDTDTEGPDVDEKSKEIAGELRESLKSEDDDGIARALARFCRHYEGGEDEESEPPSQPGAEPGKKPALLISVGKH